MIFLSSEMLSCLLLLSGVIKESSIFSCETTHLHCVNEMIIHVV